MSVVAPLDSARDGRKTLAVSIPKKNNSYLPYDEFYDIKRGIL